MTVWAGRRDGSARVQARLVLQGALEVTDSSQNSRLGSSMAEIRDMNGDGFQELVVGAPLEDDHQGAVYVFYGQGKSVQPRYRQVKGAGLDPPGGGTPPGSSCPSSCSDWPPPGLPRV